MLSSTSLCNYSLLAQTFGEKDLRIVSSLHHNDRLGRTTCLANSIVDLV